jgi:hypothetical protein
VELKCRVVSDRRGGELMLSKVLVMRDSNGRLTKCKKGVVEHWSQQWLLEAVQPLFAHSLLRFHLCMSQPAKIETPPRAFARRWRSRAFANRWG